MFGFKERLRKAREEGKVTDEVQQHAEMRLKSSSYILGKWLGDFVPCDTYRLDLPNPNDLYHFNIVVTPDIGIYKDGTYVFSFSVSTDFPIVPPSILCETPIYHPNIEFNGKVCLDIIREKWTPTLSLENIAYGFRTLLEEPLAEDALNIVVKRDMMDHYDEFLKHVDEYMHGKELVVGERTIQFPKFR